MSLRPCALVATLLAGCGSSGTTDGAVPDLASLDAPIADRAIASDLAGADQAVSADLASPDLAMPDLLAGDFAYAGSCQGREAPYRHPGLPPQGYSFATLNALIDYGAAPTVLKVADIPANAGTNADGAILLSNGSWSVLP